LLTLRILLVVALLQGMYGALLPLLWVSTMIANILR
jgi:hypothetical protein